MAERSGFFPFVEGNLNTAYDNDFLAKFIGSLISNGIFNGDFAVSPGGNLTVVVPTGQAWQGPNGRRYYYYNDAPITFVLAPSDGILSRKDVIVLRWDINSLKTSAKVITGTLASSPIAPPIIRTAEQFDLKLAEIYVGVGATAISQANITDTRLDNSVCGIVSQLVKTVDTTTLFNQLQAYMAEHEAQFNADMAAFETQSSTDFNTWLDGIKEILDESTAANLLNLISTHTARTDNPHAVTSEQTGSVPNTRKVNGKALSADITLTPADIGLGSINNTADANKSVNYANSSGYANSAGSAPANGGISSNTTSIAGALTVSTAEPSSVLPAGTLWAVV